MRKGLKILVSSSFAFNTAAGAFAPLYAIFILKIGGGILEASWIWSLQTLIVGVLIFLLSKMEDKIDKRRMLVLGYTIHALGFVGYNFVSNVWQMFVLQALFGVAAAITIPAFDAFYSRSINRGKESSEWGIWESGTRIIAAGSAIVGGFIVAEFGFQYLFMLMSVFGVISAIIVSFLMRKEEYRNLFPTII